MEFTTRVELLGGALKKMCILAHDFECFTAIPHIKRRHLMGGDLYTLITFNYPIFKQLFLFESLFLAKKL